MANTQTQETLKEIAREYDWAVQIVRGHFSKGLTQLCEPRFLDRRYRDFIAKDDPIYVDLLTGMGNEALAKTFVSYWTIAHTLATQSRFWLEDAVTDIILHQVRLRQHEKVEVYSAKMLGAGYLLHRKPVAQLGEKELEAITSRSPWEISIKTSVLSQVDLLVGEQERHKPAKRKPFQVRQWSSQENEAAQAKDADFFSKIVGNMSGDVTSDLPLQCNLLVVDPDKARGATAVQAFRFVNPKTLSNHASRKQERVNVLRLYGYLVQERIYDDPKTISVAVAELLPRYSDYDMSDRYPDYFSSTSYWTYDRVWKFVGVPYDVVTVAVRLAAQEFKQSLIGGLQSLLPGEGPLFPDARAGKKR